jgi:hypothetical protein
MSAWPRHRWRRGAFALIACLAAPHAGAEEAGYTLDALLAAFRLHAHRHATFTERYSTHVLDRPVEASGELLYDAPDHLEKRTLKPRPERLALDGTTLTLERRGRTRTTTLAATPEAAPYIDSVRATLAGDQAGLERVFRIEFSGTRAAWTLALAPRAAADVARVREIRIDGGEDRIRTIRIALANGDESLMTLTDPGD